ncbi:MAG: aldehyde dehydrogenase family protein, partial [Parvularculaceae bacterium]|nr:aldehyde dehydrogenase family protein [Parvularculaceae bacterium]
GVIPENGVFVRPAAFELDRIEDLAREVFGPVLHVVRFRAGALGDVISAVNASGYGLTLGLHTRIDEMMEEVASAARVGNIYVNRNQIGAVVGVQPFGGEGLSGTGPKAGGPHYVAALTRLVAPSAAAVAPAAALDETRAADPRVVERADRAFRDAFAADRALLLRKAAEQTEGDAAALLREAAGLAADNRAVDLPGPSGEANTLKMRGRGVALCLGGEASLRLQIVKALAAGDAVLAGGLIAASVEAAFARAGLPSLVIALDGAVPLALLEDPRIRLVAFDGAPDMRVMLRRRLAARTGPIAPLLRAADPLWRYATERTLTVNTTAAGGDVRLLSLVD